MNAVRYLCMIGIRLLDEGCRAARRCIYCFARTTCVAITNVKYVFKTERIDDAISCLLDNCQLDAVDLRERGRSGSD